MSPSPSVGGHEAVIGDGGADPKVARIHSIGADGIIDLKVLSDSVEAHRDLVTPVGGVGGADPVVDHSVS